MKNYILSWNDVKQRYLEFHRMDSFTENMTVGDMFMGSGTTALACMNTNRNFIGIELEEEYHEIAKKGWKKKEKKKIMKHQPCLMNRTNLV